jgi:glycosyltransferase involved in cell wall biosynthesis
MTALCEESTSNDPLDQPAVSVVMAIRNSEPYLRQALESIRKQTVNDYEVLVVDGGSHDNGPAIARSYPRTVCMQQSGAGFADAWNAGIAASRGRFIAFLDSDDLWTSDKLRTQLGVFHRNPATEYVTGLTEFFLEPNMPTQRRLRPTMLGRNHLGHMPGAALIRRQVVDRLGPFKTDLAIASDIEWFARLRDTTVIETIDNVVLRKRLHGANLSLRTSAMVFARELLVIARQRVDARRRK